MTAPPASFLATRRGRLLLLLLCAVQFLDVVDSSIMNVALPSIRRDLRATNSRGEPVIHPAVAPMPPASRFPCRNRPISPRPQQPTLTGSEPPAEVL